MGKNKQKRINPMISTAYTLLVYTYKLLLLLHDKLMGSYTVNPA